MKKIIFTFLIEAIYYRLLTNHQQGN